MTYNFIMDLGKTDANFILFLEIQDMSHVPCSWRMIHEQFLSNLCSWQTHIYMGNSYWDLKSSFHHYHTWENLTFLHFQHGLHPQQESNEEGENDQQSTESNENSDVETELFIGPPEGRTKRVPPKWLGSWKSSQASRICENIYLCVPMKKTGSHWHSLCQLSNSCFN